MLLYALAIIALGVLIIVHEGGHYLAARASGMRVDRFSIGFGPAIAHFRRGETIFQIGAIPLGGFVQIAGLNPGEESIAPDDPRSYPNRPVWQRFVTIFAGPGINYVFSVLMMAIVYVTFGVVQAGDAPMVGELVKGMPAETAGLQLDDEVVSVDGQPVKDMSQVVRVVESSGGRPLTVEFVREGQRRAVDVTPRQLDGAWKIGVHLVPREVFVRKPVVEALGEAAVAPYRLTVRTLAMLSDTIRGKVKANFSGPVGIVKQLKKQIARGTPEGLTFIALLSALLGLFNLLPLPALDGGRLVFLAYEAAARRRVNQRIEQAVHLAGFVCLLAFILWVTVGDVRR